MPKEGIKKTTKKTTPKKLKEKTKTKKVKKSKKTTLKKTEEAPMAQGEKKIEKEKHSFEYLKNDSNSTARKWLWTGIAIITVFMIIIWIMSFKLQIENYDKLQNEDSDLIQKTQEHWNDAFEKTKTKENIKQNVKKQIEDILKEIKNVEVVSTTTTSTPLDTASTTSTIPVEELLEQATTTINE